MPSFQVLVLGFLFVSFHPSQFRSHSRSTGASLLFRFLASPSLPGFPLLFPLSFVRFFSGSDYSAFCSSVPFFLALPLSGFSSAPVLPFGAPAFHLLFRLVSHASFPVSGTWLSVCFLSSFPVSLPQPFHRCFPSFPLSFVHFSSGLSACFPLSFVRFSLLLTTQPSALSFPFFPFSPGSGSFGARLSAFRSACFHASLSALVLSFLHFLSPLRCFASQWLPQLLASCFQLGHSPLLSL